MTSPECQTPRWSVCCAGVGRATRGAWTRRKRRWSPPTLLCSMRKRPVRKTRVMSTDRPSGLLQLTELDDIRRALDARQWFRAVARHGRSASQEDRRYFNLAVDLEHPQRQQVRAAITKTMEQNGTAPTRRRLVGVDGDYTTGKSQAVAHIMI